MVPPLRRVTFEKRESNQSALAPPLGASPRLGMPEIRPCCVGPPPPAIHGLRRLNRHPCRFAPRSKVGFRPTWFNGALKIKIKIKSRTDQKQSRSKAERERWYRLGPVGANLFARRPDSQPILRLTHRIAAFGSSYKISVSSHNQVGCQAAALLILIWDAPLNHAGRSQI